MSTPRGKPLKVKDVTRIIRKAVVASSLSEMKLKVAERFNKPDKVPKICYDACGTEIDDEEYFSTLKPNAELIAVFPGERWIDVGASPVATHYVTITSRRLNTDETDEATLEIERIRMEQVVAQLRTNLCNMTVLSDTDLEALANMDPDSVSDLGHREFVTHIKEIAGRLLREKETAGKAIDLLNIASANHEITVDLERIPKDDNEDEDEEQLLRPNSLHPGICIDSSESSSAPTSSLSMATTPEQPSPTLDQPE